MPPPDVGQPIIYEVCELRPLMSETKTNLLDLDRDAMLLGIGEQLLA